MSIVSASISASSLAIGTLAVVSHCSSDMGRLNASPLQEPGEKLIDPSFIVPGPLSARTVVTITRNACPSGSPRMPNVTFCGPVPNWRDRMQPVGSPSNTHLPDGVIGTAETGRQRARAVSTTSQSLTHPPAPSRPSGGWPLLARGDLGCLRRQSSIRSIHLGGVTTSNRPDFSLAIFLRNTR